MRTGLELPGPSAYGRLQRQPGVQCFPAKKGSVNLRPARLMPHPGQAPADPGHGNPIMPSQAKASRTVCIGLALAILLDTGLQIFWKLAVADMPDQPTLWQTARDIFHEPIFIVVGLLMIAQACNWIVVLDHADLSYAHAITSLSYVSVAALSVVSLGETISGPQMLGIGLILAGVWFVGKSGRTGASGQAEGA